MTGTDAMARRHQRGPQVHPEVTGGWVYPLLGLVGILAVGGYLMSSYSSASAAATDAPDISATTDLLKAAFAAVLALSWAVFGAWLGMRRATEPKPLGKLADGPRPTAGTNGASDLSRAPTCERMFDETRLVPHYLRCARFPAMKQDLVRLASEHTDEGQALRRLERIPERRYSSLHDLIREIRVD